MAVLSKHHPTARNISDITSTTEFQPFIGHDFSMSWDGNQDPRKLYKPPGNQSLFQHGVVLCQKSRYHMGKKIPFPSIPIQWIKYPKSIYCKSDFHQQKPLSHILLRCFHEIVHFGRNMWCHGWQLGLGAGTFLPEPRRSGAPPTCAR